MISSLAGLGLRESARTYGGPRLQQRSRRSALSPEDLPAAFIDPEALVGWVRLAKPRRLGDTGTSAASRNLARVIDLQRGGAGYLRVSPRRW